MGPAALTALLLFPPSPPRFLDLTQPGAGAYGFWARPLDAAPALAAAHALAMAAGEQDAAGDGDDAPLPAVTALALWPQQGGTSAAAAAAAAAAAVAAVAAHASPDRLAPSPARLLEVAVQCAREGKPKGILLCCAILAGQSWCAETTACCLSALRRGADRLHLRLRNGCVAPPEAQQACCVAVRAVTDALRLHAASAGVLSAAADVLYRLAWPNTQGWAPARGAARRCGAVPLLCAAAREHAGEPEPAARAARALAALLFADARSKRAAADAGALVLLPQLQARHASSALVARQTLWAIGNVAFACPARQARAVAAGAATAAVQGLAAFGESAEHAFLGATLLQLLAGAQDDASRAALLAAGAVEACVTVVRRHAASPRALGGAVRCLRALLGDGGVCAADARMRARAADAVPPLGAAAAALARALAGEPQNADTRELLEAAQSALALLQQ
jgi:hypothetical protein